MTDQVLIPSIADWLADEALGNPDLMTLFDQTCRKLYSSGVPITRASFAWMTLHPLVSAEQALWVLGDGVELQQFSRDDEEADNWQRSPLKFMLDSDCDYFRRRLDGSDQMGSFPLLTELAEQGFTDYFGATISFWLPAPHDRTGKTGVLASWATDLPGGFRDDDLLGLQTIQKPFAFACKTVLQQRIARNIAETYLGGVAGDRVLKGHISRGDGETVPAVVWYSDMRQSTVYSEAMARSDYIALLNAYFECTAGAVLHYGGEVLDFIGDAVIGIFPIHEPADNERAALAALNALDMARTRLLALNAQRRRANVPPLEFGTGLNRGDVMFGNIGVAERLSFSVIGPIVNEVARIEDRTKALGVPALASQSIAEHAPERWRSVGPQELRGFSEPIELFAWIEAESKPADIQVH